MMRESRCPHCHKRLRVAAQLVRPRVRCPICKHVFHFKGKLVIIKSRRGGVLEILKFSKN
jgi:predicted Zn finger-like uncharacterized protein